MPFKSREIGKNRKIPFQEKTQPLAVTLRKSSKNTRFEPFLPQSTLPLHKPRKGFLTVFER
jgi:hypothetical protein